MGKSLQDLGLKDEQLPPASQALDNLPEFGQWQPPPQPGSYRFKLPDDLSSIYDVYDTPNKIPPQRIRAIFDKDHPLTIVQSPGGRNNTEPFQTRLSNEERPRGRDKSIVASDLDYLFRALGVKEKPWVQYPQGPGPDNKAYIRTLTAMPKKEFGADVRFSWRCQDSRNIRVRDQQGNVQEVQNKPGCNTAYYQEDLPGGGKDASGMVPTEIQCQCGALLRCFANLDNIRA